MKYLISGLFLWVVISGGANGAILDVSRLTKDGEFSATFGAAFKTGLNAQRSSQTDFSSGRIHNLSLTLDYTFIDDLTLVFSTNNDYSDAEFGMRWKIIKTFPLKLDFISNYGFAWTHDALTHDRLGQNNIDGGFRFHGIAWTHFQWALKFMGQFVFADTGNFWNINTTSELMWYFYDNFAAKLAFDYDFLEIERPLTQHNQAIGGGLVYNMSAAASVNPYIKYHFKTRHGKGQYRDDNNFWKLGLQFSVKF